MTDREMQQLFPDFLAGRLDPEISHAIELRCEESPVMGSALNDAKKYVEAINAVEPIRAPDTFLEMVHQRINEPQSLFDRLFKPFHFKLPIELAGVVVTVLLVVLLYNPFSGRLPQELVRQRASGYEKIQNTPIAAPPSLPAPDAEKEPAPLKEVSEKETAITAKKKNRALLQESKPKVNEPFANNESVNQPAVPHTPAPLKTAENEREMSASSETFAPEQPPIPDIPFSGDLQKSDVSGMSPPPPEPPAPASPAPFSSAQSAPSAAPHRSLKQEPPTQSAGSAVGYTVTDADASMDEIVPERETTPTLHVTKSAPFKKSRKKYRAERRNAAAPAAEMKEQQAIEPPLYQQVEKCVRRYQGTIDSIIFKSDLRVKIKVSLTPDNLIGFKKSLSDEFQNLTISDSVTASDIKKVTAVIEVRR